MPSFKTKNSLSSLGLVLCRSSGTFETLQDNGREGLSRIQGSEVKFFRGLDQPQNHGEKTHHGKAWKPAIHTVDGSENPKANHLGYINKTL